MFVSHVHGCLTVIRYEKTVIMEWENDGIDCYFFFKLQSRKIELPFIFYSILFTMTEDDFTLTQLYNRKVVLINASVEDSVDRSITEK